MDAAVFKEALVKLLSRCDWIYGIGQTGDLNAPLIPGRSDIDMFVLCDRIPEKAERLRIYDTLLQHCDRVEMEVCHGGVWGCGDIFFCNQIDVMPMYFTISEMQAYLTEILAGQHLEKDGRFYPIGRLASIETLNVLYEKESAWTALIDMVQAHPRALFDAWYASETSRIIDDEDLGRAELRHELLFFHQVAEEFLDHFLQALYAKNDTYFPSRKRTEKAIESFGKKPERCYKRLMNIVALGAHEDTIVKAVAEMRALAEELKQL